MTDAVRDSYDARAKEYANLFLDHLDRVPHDREWLGAFARLASPGAGWLRTSVAGLEMSSTTWPNWV